MTGSAGPGAEQELPAVPSSVATLRAFAVGFATAEQAPDVALAVSEVVSNAVLHAYRGGEPGPVRVRCWSDGDRLVVEVADEGVGMAARDDSPGLGHGLAAVGARASGLEVTPGADGTGTVVRMTFGPPPPPGGTGLETLCALALDLLADASCVDVIADGVLRRAAAEVRGDDVLSAWLRESTPPAKPGTATWAAMREGGARLVVHDPAVPRSPGGPGERLGLTWWVSVPLDGADGAPAALWGFGGREDGFPVPGEAVLRAVADAATGDLSDPAQLQRLRAHLG